MSRMCLTCVMHVRREDPELSFFWIVSDSSDQSVLQGRPSQKMNKKLSSSAIYLIDEQY
jgi:hypothetical protein